MLKVKTVYDNREELAAALRSGRHKQRVGGIGNWPEPTETTCFLGVALREFDFFGEKKIYPQLGAGMRTWVGTKLGLGSSQINRLVDNNDSGQTFHDLAADLEKLP